MTLGTSFCLLVTMASSTAQVLDDGAQRKRAVAIRVPDGSIRVDGLLDDRAWGQAVPIADFIQKEPREGAPPTEETEVRVVYDNDAIYLGARMYNRGRLPIQAPMGRRDGIEEQAEYLLVALDTFLDRRTAYAFGVSATGVRMDRYHPQDDEAASLPAVWSGGPDHPRGGSDCLIPGAGIAGPPLLQWMGGPARGRARAAR